MKSEMVLGLKKHNDMLTNDECCVNEIILWSINMIDHIVGEASRKEILSFLVFDNWLQENLNLAF